MQKNNGDYNSNSCENMLDKIFFYVEDELNDYDKNMLEGHLSTCDDCKKTLQEFYDLKNSLINIEQLECPPELELRIKGSLNSIKPNMKENRFNYKKWSAVAAVFVVGFISIQMYNGLNSTINPDEARLSNGAYGVNEKFQAEVVSTNDQTTTMKVSSPDLKYLDIINEKLLGYKYEIVSENIEKAEIVLNIVSDKDGNIINKKLIIRYDQDSIFIDDNWLEIKL